MGLQYRSYLLVSKTLVLLNFSYISVSWIGKSLFGSDPKGDFVLSIYPSVCLFIRTYIFPSVYSLSKGLVRHQNALALKGMLYKTRVNFCTSIDLSVYPTTFIPPREARRASKPKRIPEGSLRALKAPRAL